MKQIEVHIDFACPFSYIGGERLIQFFEKNHYDTNDIVFRSFQLQPEDDNTHRSYIENRFKNSQFRTIDEYRSFFNNSLGRQAAEIGLNYDVDTIVSVNSIHAHMGLQFAEKFNKHVEYFRAVMSGHFETGKDYYDFDFIDGVLKDLGLDTEAFHKDERALKDAVMSDRRLAARRGINSVPTFYANNRVMLQGTGSDAAFANIVSKIQ